MSDDGVIRIGTAVDISALKAGMSEAAATVKASTSQMEAAYGQLAQATVAYTGTTATLRDAIKQLTTGAIPYTESIKVLVPILKDQTAASAALSAAKQQLISVERAETAATEQVSAATRNVTSNYYAAQGAAGLLEGRIPFRAMERFVASSSAVSGILSAAFPVIGAIALAEVVVDATEKIIKLSSEASELARQTGVGWLDAAVGQFDGLKEAAKEADDQMMVLARDMDQLHQKSQSLDIEKIRLTQGDSAAYQAQIKQQQEYITSQSAILTPLQQEANMLRGKLAGAKTYEQNYGALGEGLQPGDREKFMSPNEQAKARLRLQEIDKEMQSINAHISDANKQMEVFGLEAKKAQEAADKKSARTDNAAARKAAEAQRKAEEAAVQGARQALDSLRATHAMTAVEESQFWAGMAAESTAGSKLYSVGWDEAAKATARAQEEAKRALDRWDDQANRQFLQQTKDADELKRKQDELALAIQESSARISDAQTKASQSVQEADMHANEASGSISKLAAAQETARIHAQAYREELKRLDDELTKLTEDESLTPQQRAQKEGELQAHKVQVQGEAKVTGIADQSAIDQQISDPYLKAFQKITDSWMQVQNRMFYSTRNLSLEFAKMGQSILISTVGSLEKMALTAIEKEAVMTLTHRMGVTQRVATDASGAAASTALSKSSSLGQGIDAAKLAFKNTYAVVSGWPFVGPILAPALASAAFVAVAAFEDGTGYVPRDGMAYLHEGEAVVPAPTVNELRGSDGSGITINHTANINAPTEKAIINAIRRNPHEIAGALRKHLRQTGKG